MKLETSQELLERLRVHLGGVSYYRIAKELDVAYSAVLRWKDGKGGMGREYAPRVAELLGEPPEYVLASIEHAREPDAGVRRIWKRIAEAFRSKAAAITLIAGLGLLPVPSPVAAQDLGRVSLETVNGRSIDYAKRRRPLRRRWWRDLLEAWLTWLPAPAHAWRLV